MTYIPELRDSLVQAAQRQVSTGPDPEVTGLRRRPSLGGAALIAASVAALVVAGIVLVLAGHRAPNPSSPAPAASAYPSRAAARTAAAQVLAAFRPPAGAVALHSDPSRPRRLGRPADGLPVSGAVDLHRFYRVPGDPQTVMNAITPPQKMATNGLFGAGSGETSSGGSSASGAIQSASATFPLAPSGLIGRELQVEATSLPGGGTGVRIDAQAWLMVPRSITEHIPTNVSTILVRLIGHLPRTAKGLHPMTRVVAPLQVSDLVRWVNAIPVRQRYEPRCVGPPAFRIRLDFVGTGQHPDPVAVIDPNCAQTTLSLGGRSQPTLMWGSAADPLRGIQLIELLLGAPKTTYQTLRGAVVGRTAGGASTAQPVPAGPLHSRTATAPGP